MYNFQNIYKGENINTMNNIISGPMERNYWNHSPNLKKPLVKEEGPLPILGNIGELIKMEAISNFKNCSEDQLIGGSPNCSGTFVPDYFTKYDKCGKECELKNPEIFGDKNFGLINNKITDSHGIHAYDNIRANAEGQTPSETYGCYEFVPNLSKNDKGSCKINIPVEYQQVGNWLPMYNWSS
jgi:hypothetical protein